MMKKLVMLMAVAALGLAATGCATNCGSGNCRIIKPKRGGCNDQYCRTIGAKLGDERVRNGEEVTFSDGVIIRTYPKDKITPWDDGLIGQKAQEVK